MTNKECIEALAFWEDEVEGQETPRPTRREYDELWRRHETLMVRLCRLFKLEYELVSDDAEVLAAIEAFIAHRTVTITYPSCTDTFETVV